MKSYRKKLVMPWRMHETFSYKDFADYVYETLKIRKLYRCNVRIEASDKFRRNTIIIGSFSFDDQGRNDAEEVFRREANTIINNFTKKGMVITWKDEHCHLLFGNQLGEYSLVAMAGGDGFKVEIPIQLDPHKLNLGYYEIL